MKTALYSGLVVMVGTLLLPIQRSPAQDAITESSPAARNTVLLKSYPLPLELAEFGKRTESTICVVVYGEVNQPGIYYFPVGTVVRDAIQSARGMTNFAGWQYTRLLRPLDAEKAESVRFTRQAKPENSDIPLKDGDRTYFGHESY